jgi:SET domain-containing protein
LSGAANAPSFEIRARHLAGRTQVGAFAMRPIAAGETICTFTGVEYSRAGILAAIASGEVRDGADPFELGLDSYLKVDEQYIAFNHSCAPNAGFARRSDVVALRALAPGEEITCDYATNCSASNDFVMPFVCHCGAPGCRRRIGNLATIPRDQLRRYLEAGALQDYLRDEAIELLGRPATEQAPPANG